MLLPSQFSYRRRLEECSVLLTRSHHLQVALNGSQEGRLVQLDFSSAFDRERHSGLLYNLRYIGVRGHFLFLVSQFLSDRKKRVRLTGKVSVSVELFRGYHKVMFQDRCYLYCSPPSSSTLLETAWQTMQMILQSMKSFLDPMSSPGDRIAKSGFGGNPLLVFDAAYVAES